MKYVKYPEIYSKVKCNKLYKELGLEQNEVKLLENYFRASSNLYGVIQLKKIYEIYSINNKIDETLFYKFCDILKHQEELFRIMCLSDIYSNIPKCSLEDWYLIYCDFVQPNKLNKLIEDQKGKQYCILEEQLFLKYANSMYFEKSEQYKELHKYIKNNYEVKPDFFCELLVFSIKEGSSFKELIRYTDELNFQTIDEANIVIGLITNLYNNTRTPANCGNAPSDLSNEYFKPINTKNKNLSISRNDLCHCGSGKKYKKCCMLIN